MSFDFSTLITDRTQADVSYAKALAARIGAGTASEAEIAEFNGAALRGAYNHTDLNRVTAAMESLKAKLEGYGYNVPGYQRIKINHNPPPVPVEPGVSRLPDGYLELTHIESAGAQYVDSAFKPNQDTRVIMDVEYVKDTTEAATDFFGARTSTSSKAYAVQWNHTSSSLQQFYNNGLSTVSGGSVTGRQTIDMNKNVLTCGSVTNQRNYAEFQCDYSLYLFALNNAGANAFHAYAKMYSCQIYDNGELIRDFVPCVNPSGDVGLFDVVTQQFYGNAGTGVFIAGDRVDVVLPNGYTRLTHIESNGTQYIDTGFKPSNNTRVVMDAQLTSGASSQFLFGTRTSSATVNFNVLTNSTTEFRSDYGESKLNTTAVALTSRVTVDKNKNVCKINSTTITNSTSTFQCSLNLFLFAANNGGSAAYFGKVKHYSCQIYDNGTLVRDYVPCINSSGVAGLYDLVTSAFFGNSGSGSFVAGAIPRELPAGYTQTEYIESSGTQYVDTGYKPSSNSRVMMDIEVLTGTTSFLFGARHASKSTSFALPQIDGISLRTDYGTEETAISVSPVQRLSIDKNKNICVVNGVTVTSTAQTFQCSYNMFLLQNNTAGSKFRESTVARLYYCKIYDNGTLVRDFVPCKNSSGLFGLYDMVGSKFYGNSGSGSFAGGEDVAFAVNAAVAVVNAVDETEYDQHTWYEFDVPTSEDMTIYLLNVSSIRSVISAMKTTPSVPSDMANLMAQEANDIEKILVDINLLLINSTLAWYYSGDVFSGEV